MRITEAEQPALQFRLFSPGGHGTGKDSTLFFYC